MSTLNFLSPIEFRFIVSRLPNVNFNIQAVSLPGISSGYTPLATPFKPTPLAGDRLEYEDLSLQVIIDEEMKAYTETWEWLVGLTFPENFDQYRLLKESDDGLYSDATLTIMNSNKNPNIEITFENLFPTGVGGFELDTKGSDVIPPVSTMTFKYSKYKVKLVT